MLDKENLLEAANFVERIPGRLFDMERYREGEDMSTDCRTVGCALGHLTALYPDRVTRWEDGSIAFWEIPYTLFGMEDEKVINYCFASEWNKIDNTQTGCADRMRLVAEQGEGKARELWKELCAEYKLVY